MYARGSAVLAIVSAVLAVTGCGGSGSASSLPTIGPLPTIRHESDIVLPLDHYLPSPEDRAVLATAASELTARCMERLGFSGYPVDSFEAQEQTPRHGNTYLVLDEGVARRYGYGPSYLDALLRQSDALVESLKPFSGPGARDALNGSEGAERAGVTPDTKPSGTPDGGCAAEGRRALYAMVGAAEPAEIPWYANLEGMAYDRAASDPRLRPTIRAWSDCMKRQGYQYAAPEDANNDRQWSGDANQDAEAKAAVADVHCKWSSRYLDTFVALTAAYESAIVEENAERLQEGLDVRTKLLAAVSAAGLGRVRPPEGSAART